MNTLLLGKWGEAQAAEYLKKKKYKIIAANFRSPYGEIDLVAENREFLVFVEVKLRKNCDFGKPHEFVTKSKQKKLNLTARCWLGRYPTKKTARFDIIEIIAPEGISDNFSINHMENAFYGRMY